MSDVRHRLERALGGDDGALVELIDELTPVVQARVARTLLRRGGDRCGGAVRQAVEDLTQDVFVLLFDDGARVLRDWQPDRGMSLANFVGLVAERRAAAVLRSARRSPFTEEPSEPAALDGRSPDAGPEAEAAARERLRLVLLRFKEELSPMGWHLFDLLFLRERSVAEVQAETRLSADAVYAWRSRLRRQARRLVSEVPAPPTPSRPFHAR
ncbi:MAG: hypothetical protein AAGN66_03145 [Acidobacteriota bacterium]